VVDGDAQLGERVTRDLKARRIRVNAASPGTIDTPELNDLVASSETGQRRLRMPSNAVPLGRQCEACSAAMKASQIVAFFGDC
jgi:NAD(P)-dependent dehydrogenase (short-subunit alcohol dehydrogenase family)